jgi:hypothetical protein
MPGDGFLACAAAAAALLASLAAVSLIWFTLRLGIGPVSSSAPARRAMVDAAGCAARGTLVELGQRGDRLRAAPSRPAGDRLRTVVAAVGGVGTDAVARRVIRVPDLYRSCIFVYSAPPTESGDAFASSRGTSPVP